MGRLGHGILQALSDNLQIKKKNCFGFDLSGWGQGGGRGLVGGADRLGWQVAFLLAQLLLLLLSSISELKETDIFGCTSCFLFIVLANEYQLPVWIWYSGRIWRITTSTTNKRWESGSETHQLPGPKI